ncbi:MAG: energy transducer TonB [Vulcanimicrobiaceae bacterium]
MNAQILLIAALISPSAAPANTCAHGPVPAHIVGAKWPADGRRLTRPYATVIASVDPSGKVTDARLDESSGSSAGDAAALDAMRRWTFAPAEEQCRAVAGAAEFAVDFGGALTLADPLNHEALMTDAVPPQYPDSARQFGMHATVLVKVTVDEQGRLIGLSVFKSSGISAIDQAALAAARMSTYMPPVHNGVPASGMYLFRATFEQGR